MGSEITVRDNLEIFALHNDIVPRLDKLVKLLELENVIDTTYSELSSGNKQRVILAKSLMINPKLLLMDELTIALDPYISTKMRKILLSWQKKNKSTIMLATHNMYEADELCDRIAIVHKGKLISLGTPAKLKKMVSEEDTIEIKLTSYADPKAIRKLEGVSRAIVSGLFRAMV